MSITLGNVEHVAKLAKLQLSHEDKENMVEQLNNILAFADALSTVETDHVAPTSHVLPISNVMRADEPKESVSLQLALQNAPDADEGQFRVPAVLDTGSEA